MRYVRDMGLNTIRLEGKLETDEFFDLADREGILVMAGWCCCDQWEKWNKWTADDYVVGRGVLARSAAAAAHRIPSVFVWLNGSDNPPIRRGRAQATSTVEAQLEWPNRPTLSNAAEKRWRQRPQWREDARARTTTCRRRTGSPTPRTAAPSASPRRSVLEQRCRPSRACAPCCRRHTSGPSTASGAFTPAATNSRRSTSSPTALEARYGKAADADDYARKAQALTYDGQRAMFEAYARNKYTATGVDPVDAEQRVAVAHLAPLRLLPATGRRLFRHQEGVRAGARAVLVRRSLDRARQRHPDRGPRAAGLGVGPRLRSQAEVFTAGRRRFSGGRRSCAPSASPRSTD